MRPSPPEVFHVVSADGTRIGFEQSGQGPALVLVQGAMGTAYNFRELADALSDFFTVVVPDRRGRGLSPRPFSPGHTIDDDVADLGAVILSTHARYVFGLSTGADITLKAAATLPHIERVVVYEPAIFLSGVPRRLLDRFYRYTAAGNVPGMLTTAMKLAKMGPAVLRALPDWMVMSAVGAILKQESRGGAGGYAPTSELAFAFEYDLKIVLSMNESLPLFQSLSQPTLLTGGTRSPKYFGQALDRLEEIVPDTLRAVIPEADHAAAWNVDSRRNPRGMPKAVAEQLKSFFGKV